MTLPATDTPAPAPPRRAGAWLRGQLRNVAPFGTLLVLAVLFSALSPSFATWDNLGNILQQISVTAIIAVGLTFVILCAEIDLSVASVANAVGIVLAYFTAQDASVNIANVPLPGAVAIILALLASVALGGVTAFGVTKIGIPSFIMTLAMLQIAAGISAMLVRGQIAYAVPHVVQVLGNDSLGPVPWIVIVAARRAARGPRGADLHAVRALHLHGRRQPGGGGILGGERARGHRGRDGDLGGVRRAGRDAGGRAFRQRAAGRVRDVSARTRSRPSSWAGPVCSAGRGGSGTRSSGCSCWAC